MAREYDFDGVTIVVHANGHPMSYANSTRNRGGLPVTCPYCHEPGAVELGIPKINSRTVGVSCEACGRSLTGYVLQNSGTIQSSLGLRGGLGETEADIEEYVLYTALPPEHPQFIGFLNACGWREGATVRMRPLEWQCLSCGAIDIRCEYEGSNFCCRACGCAVPNQHYIHTVNLASQLPELFDGQRVRYGAIEISSEEIKAREALVPAPLREWTPIDAEDAMSGVVRIDTLGDQAMSRRGASPQSSNEQQTNGAKGCLVIVAAAGLTAASIAAGLLLSS